jgi:ribosome-binding protein aMBF1 (putative translation factor)
MPGKRIHQKTERTPEEMARIREIREQFQRERPGLEQLVASGDSPPPIPLGDLHNLALIGEVLKRAREALGLSLSAIAERSGLNEADLRRLEEGEELRPTVNLLCGYAEALGKRWVWALEDASLTRRKEQESEAPGSEGNGCPATAPPVAPGGKG